MKLHSPIRPAADELTDLDAWVRWLCDHYDIDSWLIPDCWMAHGHILEELTALHRFWLAAYGDAARPEAALRWHEALDHLQRRIREWKGSTSCDRDTHRQPQPRDWNTDELKVPDRSW